MAPQFAADLVVERPTGPGGWILIALVVVLAISILARGIVSFSTQVRDRLNPSLYFLIALGVAYLISQITSEDPHEPLVRTHVDVYPVAEGDGGAGGANSKSSDHTYTSPDEP